MASETTFDHRKVVFSWGKVRKMPFSQNPLMARFWSLGILFINHFCARKSKNLPWLISFLLMHVQDPYVVCYGSVKPDQSNSIYIFVHENQKIYHSTFFFSWCMFSSHVICVCARKEKWEQEFDGESQRSGNVPRSSETWRLEIVLNWYF